MNESVDPLMDLVASRAQIEVKKAGQRYDHGGFGLPGSKQAEERYVRFKFYIYKKYGVGEEAKGAEATNGS